ncbi:MAG: CarD family transcriptional regulator [Chloroflexota bacterium]|jgi:CarD family transcriptional regulator
MAAIEQLKEGNWIVHKRYGIGQIQGVEEKNISGESADYYRVETHNSIVWLPVDDLNKDAFRALASPEEVEEAVDILQRPPRQMASNFNTRKKRIRDVMGKNSLLSIARLVRDLWYRQTGRTLSNTEHRALRRFMQRLAAEWSVCRDMEAEEAREHVYDILRSSHAQEAMAD